MRNSVKTSSFIGMFFKILMATGARAWLIFSSWCWRRCLQQNKFSARNRGKTERHQATTTTSSSTFTTFPNQHRCNIYCFKPNPIFDHNSVSVLVGALDWSCHIFHVPTQKYFYFFGNRQIGFKISILTVTTANARHLRITRSYSCDFEKFLVWRWDADTWKPN